MTTSAEFIRRAVETEQLADKLSRNDERLEALRMAKSYRQEAARQAKVERSFSPRN